MSLPEPPFSINDNDLALPTGFAGDLAGLVSAAQGFHCRQPADHRPPPGHPAHPDRQRDRHRGRQPLRDRAYREGDRGDEHVGRALSPGQADGEGDGRQGQDHHRQHLAEAGELAGQRRGRQFGAADQPVDLPQFGLGPVATVIPAPVPLVTSVPEYSMLRLSTTDVSAGSTISSRSAVPILDEILLAYAETSAG
jgi:hypothetical protein